MFSSRIGITSTLCNRQTKSHKARKLFLERLEDRSMMAIDLVSGFGINGLPGNVSSSMPLGRSMSADGTLVVFSSVSDNLVANDTNGASDVFIKNLVTGVITRVSTTSGGQEGNESSSDARISADGTKVFFQSGASNLVVNDTNGTYDIFMKDLMTGVVTRVSTNSLNEQADGFSEAVILSADESSIVFDSYATNLVANDNNGVSDVFMKNLTTGLVTRISTGSAGEQATANSVAFSISNDGTKVLFQSGANNLVGGDTNSVSDLFVKVLQTGETIRVSTDSFNQQANGISGYGFFSPDGTKILFNSAASNLVAGDTLDMIDGFEKNLITGEVRRITTTSTGQEGNNHTLVVDCSPDGKRVLLGSIATNFIPNDANGSAEDVFIKDLDTGEVWLASIGESGQQADALSIPLGLSPDGLHAVFVSAATNLVANVNNGIEQLFVVDATPVNVVLSGGTLTFNLSPLDNTCEIDYLSATNEIRLKGDFLTTTRSLNGVSQVIVNGNGGNDTIRLNTSYNSGRPPLDINTTDGADKIFIIGVARNVSSGDGADTLSITGTVSGSVDTGSGIDVATLAAAATIGATLSTGADADTLVIAGTVAGAVDTGSGSDSVTVSGGIGGKLSTGDGADQVTFTAGSVANIDMVASAGDTTDDNAVDTLQMSGNAAIGTLTVVGSAFLGGGADIVTMTDTSRIHGDLDTTSLVGDGGDVVNILRSAIVNLSVRTGSGSDTIFLSGNIGGDLITTADGVAAGDDADTVTIGEVAGSDEGRGQLTKMLVTGAGVDTVVVNFYSIVGGSILLGTENDSATIFGDAAGGVYGGAGDDQIVAAATGGALPIFRMQFFGEDGADQLVGGAGIDLLDGGAGDDSITGNAGNDWIDGGIGHDQIAGNAGDDLIYAGAGNDIISGGAGNDILYGENGNDQINGDAGNDILLGGNQNDTLTDLQGWNILIGGDGLDTLRGGGTNGNFYLADKWSMDAIVRTGGVVAMKSSGPNYVPTGPNATKRDAALLLMTSWASSSTFSTLASRLNAMHATAAKLGTGPVTSDGFADKITLSTTSADAFYQFVGDVVTGSNTLKNRRVV